MTSASELFHSRRSRFGRSSLLELGEGGIDSSSHLYHNRISHTGHLRRHRNGNQHQSGAARRIHNRFDFDGGGPPPRRLTHFRQRPLLSNRESGLFDQVSSHFASGTINNSENPGGTQDRFRFNGNDRLPGTVLLARERLLHRLSGLSLSENRRRNRVSSSTQRIDTAVDDDFRFDIGDWENEISTDLAGTLPLTEVLTLEKRRRPPGLSQEAVKRLQVMIFNELENCEEGMASSGLEECSICLESFTEGDKLFCLPCGHRFHRHCLDPWVRICGDCPYCRMDILLTSSKAKERF